MSVLSNNDLQTVRSQNQSSDLFLGVYQPPIIFEARITGSVSKGSVDIPYYSVLTGSYTNVKSGMTMYISNEPDGDELGRVRVRSIVDGTVSVAIDKSIDYAVGQYITIRDYFEFWPVFPRATVNDSNIITYYKDWDVLYSDQNSNLNPVPILGPDYFGWFDPEAFVSGSVARAGKRIYWNSTGSYVTDGTGISVTGWEFGNRASPETSSNPNAGYIYFEESGFSSIQCTITGTNGKVSTGHRHVALFDRLGSTGNNKPITDWELKDISTDWEGGCTVKIEVGEEAYKFRDGYLVGLWCDDYYNNVKQSFGGFFDREHILFVGYVNKSETMYNAFTSKTTFYLKGITGILKNKEMFSISLEDNANPADWTQLKNMTINKILDHYFRWHTTLLNVADFTNIRTEHGDYKEQFEDITKGEILSTINSFLSARIFGNFVSDRQNRCFAEVDLNMLPTGTRPNAVMTFTEQDWVNDPKFPELVEKNISNVLLGGVAYDGQTSLAYLSRAPGLWPAYEGKSESISGLSLLATGSQNQINDLSGLYFSKLNNRIETFDQELSINIRSIDIVPQEFYNRNLLLTDTFRKIQWNNKRFIPRKISYKFENGFLQPNIEFESETSGSAGETVIIPTTPPKGTRPRRVPVNTRPPKQPGTTVPSDGNLVYVATLNRIARTRNFNSTSPTWTNVTANINTTAYGNILDFILDPWNPKNRAWVVLNYAIYRTENLDSTSPNWTLVLTRTQAHAVINSTDHVNSHFGRISGNITKEGLFIFTFYSETFPVAMGDVSGVWVFRTDDNGSSFIAKLPSSTAGGNRNQVDRVALCVGQHNDDKIFACSGVGSVKVHRSIDGGMTHDYPQILNTLSTNFLPDILTPYADNDNDDVSYVLFAVGVATPRLYKTTNNGGLWTEITPSGYTFFNTPYQIHAYTQDRQIMFVSDGIGFWFSTNGGDSWTQRTSDIPSAVGSGVTSFRAFGGFPYASGRVYAVGATNGNGGTAHIITSTDGGFTWQDKDGNWSTAIGVFTSTFNAGIMIVPVWTEPQ